LKSSTHASTKPFHICIQLFDCEIPQLSREIRFGEIPVLNEKYAALLVEIPRGINHPMKTATLDYNIVQFLDKIIPNQETDSDIIINYTPPKLRPQHQNLWKETPGEAQCAGIHNRRILIS
jgi:hypothetical protein